MREEVGLSMAGRGFVRFRKFENSWERLGGTGMRLGESNESRIGRLILGVVWRKLGKIGRGW